MIRYDVHTHAFHPKIAAKALDQLQGHYGIPAAGSGHIEDLLQRIHAAGLDRAVVHNAATTPDQVIPANNWAIELEHQYEQVIAFGTVHPDFDRWPEQLERLAAAGIVGIKLHPDFQGIALDDPCMRPIFEALQGRFICMVHVGDNVPPAQNPSSPRKIAAVHAQFPELTLIAAHFGGYLHWEEVLTDLAGLDIYLDTSSALPFLPQTQLEAIVRRHSWERILFGSDYPLFDPGEELALLQSRLALSTAQLERLWQNTADLFAPGRPCGQNTPQPNETHAL